VAQEKRIEFLSSDDEKEAAKRSSRLRLATKALASLVVGGALYSLSLVKGADPFEEPSPIRVVDIAPPVSPVRPITPVPAQESLPRKIEEFRREAEGNRDRTPRSPCYGYRSKDGLVPYDQSFVSDFRRSALQNRYDPAKDTVIVLDRGHGHETELSPFGYDTGAIRRGLKETAVIDAVADQLVTHLTRAQLLGGRQFSVVETRHGMKEGITLTRNYIPEGHISALQWRSDLANSLASYLTSYNVIFLSLHADAYPDPQYGGASVALYASPENPQQADSRVSLQLAEALVQNFSLHSGEYNTNILHQDSGVLRCTHPEIPAVILELGRLSNPHDWRVLNGAVHDPNIAQLLSSRISSGVIEFERLRYLAFEEQNQDTALETDETQTPIEPPQTDLPSPERSAPTPSSLPFETGMTPRP
jgi:N-acetylmuramoyl-L-alanine amidase